MSHAGQADALRIHAGQRADRRRQFNIMYRDHASDYLMALDQERAGSVIAEMVREREGDADELAVLIKKLANLDGPARLPGREGVHILDDPARAAGEARRVLAPGGRIVLIGQDWDTFVIDADDAALTRTIVHARADLVPTPRRPPLPQPPPGRGLR